MSSGFVAAWEAPKGCLCNCTAARIEILVTVASEHLCRVPSFGEERYRPPKTRVGFVLTKVAIEFFSM